LTNDGLRGWGFGFKEVRKWGSKEVGKLEVGKEEVWKWGVRKVDLRRKIYEFE
jgi:hypothetical protein